MDVCLPHLAGPICAEHAEKEQLLQLVSQKDVSALLGLEDDTAIQHGFFRRRAVTAPL